MTVSCQNISFFSIQSNWSLSKKKKKKKKKIDIESDAVKRLLSEIFLKAAVEKKKKITSICFVLQI